MSSFDITFCPNKTCTKRANCERNTDRIDPEYPLPVWMADFQQDENGDCEYYVPVDGAEEEDND